MTEFLTNDQIETATSVIRNHTQYRPKVGLVLGSGLSSLAAEVEHADIIEYDRIPHWPISTVSGHSGRLVLGRLEDLDVVMLQGRAHYYEGYTMSQLTMPIRAMMRLGIQTLIVTNAAGGLNPDFEAGDLMLIRDHINLLGMAGLNPLRGPNDKEVGPRFPDMTHPYDDGLLQMAQEVARDDGSYRLWQGVYAYVAGPSYETPAELRFLRMIGADAVGMSTVPAVVVARHAGIRVLGISTITNMANIEPAAGAVTSHEEVLEIGTRVLPRLTHLIHGILRHL